MSYKQKGIISSTLRRLLIENFSMAQADRSGADEIKTPLPENLLYDEDKPVCTYCQKKSNLRVGRLSLSGVVAFCPRCEEQYKSDKKWESG